MNLYQLLLPLLVLFSPLETNINQTPAPLDHIASEIQEEWNNTEEYQKKQAIKHRQALDTYYAQDAYTRKANQARQAGYLAGEMIQLVFGPTEIIKGVSKLSKLPKLLGKNKILSTLAKAGIAEEKIAEFDRISKIPDKVKRTQAINQFLTKEKQIEKTLQKAKLLPKLSKNTNKLNKASKARNIDTAIQKSGSKLLNQYNSIDSLIKQAGRLERKFGGVKQGWIKGKGSAESIFKNIAQKHGAKIQLTEKGKSFFTYRNIRVTLYNSSTNGIPTLQIKKSLEKVDKIFKIRVKP